MAAPRTLILTRPERQSADFAAALEARLPGRFRPVFAPVLRIVAVPGAIDLDGVTALVFTSANGVEQFAARVATCDLPAFCVGAMTAEAARGAGFTAHTAGGDVAALAALIASAHRPDDGVLLHVRGRHAAGDLTGRLRAAALQARAAEIYDQQPREIAGPARDLLAAGRTDVIAVFSPRSAECFATQARQAAWDLSGATVLSLSPAGEAALAGIVAGRRIVAAEPTRDAMIAALAGA